MRQQSGVPAQYCIIPDVQATKRRRWHYIYTVQGDYVATFKSWDDLIDWLTANEQSSALLRVADSVYRIEFWILADIQEPSTWPKQ